MLKRKLTKAEFEALPDAVRAYYTAHGEDYTLNLQVSPDDDPGELRRARDREKANAADEKARADRLQAQVDTLVSDPNKQKDIKVLEDSWRQKLTDKETELNKKVANLQDHLKKTLVTDKALTLATKLAGDNAHILVPHIERRLQANLEGDAPSTRVLDRAGQLSAATFEDLEKEIVDGKQFSAIIVASKASGGATGRATGTSSAVLNGKKFNELTEAERVEFHKTDPSGFKQASEAHRTATRRF